jgi:uncharacterized membrane protein
VIRARGERGAVIPLLALSLSLIILVGAFSVDLGRAMLLRRDLQRVADIAALDASRFLTAASASSQLTTVRDAAVRSAARNGWTLDPTDVHLVRVTGTTITRIDHDTTTPDGVEVVVEGSVSYNFQPGSADTARSAVATRQSAAGIEIGTRVGTIDSTQASMLNRVFGVLGGTSGMNLTVVSWQGLADADVTLGDLVAAAGSADADSFLRTSAAYGTQLQLLADALSQNGDALAAGSVNAFRTALGASVSAVPVKAGDLLSVTTTDADAFADATVNALTLLQGELMLARKGSALSGTFSSGVAGIADVSLNVQVVQPPKLAFGPTGTSATTGQIAFGIGTNLLGLVPVQLDVGAANGTATLASIACSAMGPSSSATATVQTSLTDVTLQVATVPVGLSTPAVSPTTLTFTSPFTWAHAQHVGATSIGLTAAVGGAVGGAGPIVNALVGPLIAPLEHAVVAPILRSLGVSLAGADVAVLAPVCLPPLLTR